MTPGDQDRHLKMKEAQATILFLLTHAYEAAFEGHMLIVEHSFEHGFFCHDPEMDMIGDKTIKEIEHTVKTWINEKDALRVVSEPKDLVLKRAASATMHNRVEIAEKWPYDLIPVLKYGSFWDIIYGPVTTDRAELVRFELRSYRNGLLIRFPSYLDPGEFLPFTDQPKLFSIISESEERDDLLGVSTIYSLNEAIRNSQAKELIWTAEGIHEKKISQIADALSSEFPWKRVITVAGPSSSGKTTFSKRLKIQLRVNGFRTHTLSMDDYYRDRDTISAGNNATQDFESLQALNTELMTSQVDTLVNGGKIKIRKFDFNSGKGVFTGDTMQLGEWDFLTLEGIHGLNPDLTGQLNEEILQKIYVSAMTPLNIDPHNRVSTADNRLIRRMIRDLKFRGYTVSDTLNRWPSVRKGEEQNIFPHQERADHIFNTALAYEMAVLAPLLLQHLGEEKIDTDYVKREKNRLRLFLSFFESLDEKMVPGISILREFIGSSDFDY